MLWFIFKQVFSVVILIMLVLVYFKIDNKRILACTSGMLIAYIPLRRFFRHVDYNDAVINLLENYPILEIVDMIMPILILIMTFVVVAKYKKNKSLNND